MTTPPRDRSNEGPGPVRTREEVLYDGEFSRVVRVWAPDGSGSLIRKESVGAAALKRLRHERAMLRRLGGVDGVPQLIEREPRADWILMEDPHARPVTDMVTMGEMDTTELIRLALALTRIIGAIHRRGVLHRDIDPNNILLTEEHEPVLIDYHLSTMLSDERLDTTRTSEIVGTLAYVSPEQTGRTGRRVDQRSDLYALGATLYEMATGRPPFGRGDPLRLVHDHLARIPAPPIDINRRLPRSLSDVVMRLLEKEPDSRYQTAEGLATDLIIVGDELNAGRSTPVSLGTRDFPQRLRAPSGLIGRTSEISVLTAQYAEARQGRARAALIAGRAGVGKGALVEHLRPTVVANGGWMVTGRFDQYRQDSRSDAVWQALRALGRQMLTETEENLNIWRAAVRDSLGANAGLIAALAPEFGLLLDERPQVPNASDLVQVERRGHQSALDLIRAVVDIGRPLVMALDDLQWAGPTALAIVDDLFTDNRLKGLLVVGTYRDDELAPDDPLVGKLDRWQSLAPPPRMIRLENLSDTDLATFLRNMLRLPEPKASELARAVGSRSHGNPYDTVELVNALRHDGTLVQRDGDWSWDNETLWHQLDRGDVVALLSERLAALPAPSIDLLEVMACLGGTVEIVLLADASGIEVSRVEELIATPEGESLVMTVDGADATVRFTHDRVQQAVASRLSRSQRKRINRAAAQRLAPVTQFAAVAADQYLATVDTIDDPEEARSLVDLLHRAARDVRTLNPASAERFLTTAISQLESIRTPGDEQLLLGLRTELHSVLGTLARYDDMDRVFAEIHRDSEDPLGLVDAVSVQIGSLLDRTREQAGVELGFDLLRRLGITVPSLAVGAPTAQQWTDLYDWARNLDLAEDLSRPSNHDSHAHAVARILEATCASAFFLGPTTLAWLVFEAQRLWVRDGPSRSLAVTLALTPAVTTSLRHDYHTGYPVMKHLLAVCEGRGYEPATSFVRSGGPLFTLHWFEPLENSVEPARRARDGLLKAGWPQPASYIYDATLAALLDTALTIDAVADEADRAVALAESTGNQHALFGLITYRQLLRALRGQTDAPGSFTDDSIDENEYLRHAHPADASVYRVNRALSALLFCDLDELSRQAAAALPLARGMGDYREALAHLLQALAVAQQMVATAPRTEMLSEVDRCRDWLDQRADDAPVNFRHLVHLIDAERARAVGDYAGAAAAFDAALFGAGNRSRPWQRAVIAERAAQFYLDRGLEYVGRTLITECWRRYEAWGANAKVAALEREYPFLRGTSSTQRELGLDPTGTARLSSDVLDLVGLIQASQALSSERNLDRLRARVTDTLTEVTGATNIQVLLWDTDSKDWVKPPDRHGSAVAVDEAAAQNMLPLSAFRYSERTREPLLVDDAIRDDRFSDDPYFRDMQRCSLMVIPVLTHSEPRAMLVLENRLSRGAFTTDRLDAANLIAGQLSVSLDNALIYASLERKVSERTKELEIANRRLEVLAVTDALTGLANRRRLLDVLEVELLRSLRTGSATGVMMIDIDHFKPYNDRYGHVAGDDVLRKVSDALSRSLRSTDVIARYGGEEFAVVLPHTGQAESKDVAERARAAVAALREPHLGSPGGTVTVSIGIASQTATRQTTTEQVLAAADAQLYRAKGQGRNRVSGLPN